MKTSKILLLLVLSIFFVTERILSFPVNPYINNVTPSQNAVSVNKSSNITIVFAQDMNPTTITNANIKVFGYQTGLLPVTIDYNVAVKTVNINPNQDLKTGEKISVTLTSGIRTISNENITPFVYTFYVQAIGGNAIFTRTSVIDNVLDAVIKSGDIDRDGDIDIVVNNKIYYNDGNAGFTFSNALPLAGIPEIADFDNDGDLDILIENSGNIYFYGNDGLGNFTQRYSFAGNLGDFGDLDGDGYLDIASFLTISEIGTYNNDHGLFVNGFSYNFTGNCLPGDYLDKVLIDDFNNDGKPDALGIHGATGGGIFFYTLCRSYDKLNNQGNRIFNPENIFSGQLSDINVIIYFYRGGNSLDVNNDGFIDIISPGIQLRNNGNGVFTNMSTFTYIFSLVSDLNGDGFMDMVVGYNSLYINDGNGNFTYFPGNGEIFSSGAYGDFDNDGDIDLALYNFLTNRVSILLNGDTPLPVELSSFTSETVANNVTLNWSTSSEENNSGYDIERLSTGGVRGKTLDVWNKTGFVQGNGNSNTSQNYTFTDKKLQSGKYKYRLKQIDFNGNYKYYELSNEVIIGIPGKFYLSQNYPNPFNPFTDLEFGISDLGFVSLKVHDALGNEVAVLVNEKKNSGSYEVEFDGSSYASGIYFYSLYVDGVPIDTKRMVLLK